MKTPTQSHDEFVNELNNLLDQIRAKAVAQYEYNLKTNIPEKIGGMTFDNAAQQAINHGLSSGFNTVNKWDTEKAIRIAYDIMEDCNCHGECRALSKFIPEFN